MAPRTDPRLAALYDDDNPDGPDHDWFRSVAAQRGAQRIGDLGCGTGILTVTLAGPERSVFGVDPDEGMLDVARAREGHGGVTWIVGDSRALPADLDLVVMSGNVAQHIGPADWDRSLRDIGAALRVGGTLAFETRNPAARAWESWTPDATTGTRTTPDGELTDWLDVTGPDEHGTIVLHAYNRWDSGEELVVDQPLTFRSYHTVERDLRAAGMEIGAVWGGWAGETFDDETPLMVIEARRVASPG